MPELNNNQFNDIIGTHLLTDSIEKVGDLKDLVTPYADPVFKTSLSDTEILNHPAVKAHNYLFHAENSLRNALDEKNQGNTSKIMGHGIQAHKHLMTSLMAALQVPELESQKHIFAKHFNGITKNLHDLNEIYGENKGE